MDPDLRLLSTCKHGTVRTVLQHMIRFHRRSRAWSPTHWTTVGCRRVVRRTRLHDLTIGSSCRGPCWSLELPGGCTWLYTLLPACDVTYKSADSKVVALVLLLALLHIPAEALRRRCLDRLPCYHIKNGSLSGRDCALIALLEG